MGWVYKSLLLPDGRDEIFVCAGSHPGHHGCRRCQCGHIPVWAEQEYAACWHHETCSCGLCPKVYRSRSAVCFTKISRSQTRPDRMSTLIVYKLSCLRSLPYLESGFVMWEHQASNAWREDKSVSRTILVWLKGIRSDLRSAAITIHDHPDFHPRSGFHSDPGRTIIEVYSTSFWPTFAKPL